MFELLTIALFQFFAINAQPPANQVGGTGWGGDAHVGGTGWGGDAHVGGTGWGGDTTQVGGTGWGGDAK